MRTADCRLWKRHVDQIRSWEWYAHSDEPETGLPPGAPAQQPSLLRVPQLGDTPEVVLLSASQEDLCSGISMRNFAVYGKFAIHAIADNVRCKKIIPHNDAKTFGNSISKHLALKMRARHPNKMVA